MSDFDVADLTADIAPTGDDLIYTVNDPSGTPADRKVTLTNLAASAPFTNAAHVKDYATARRTSGNVTANSTAWANVDTGIDLTLTAATGDVIVVGINGLAGNEAVAIRLDAVTVVSASPLNSFGKQGAVEASPGVQGVLSWYGGTGANTGLGGSAVYTLVSGDISGGTVTLRLRYSTGSAANKTLYAGTNEPFMWWAMNIGPAT